MKYVFLKFFLEQLESYPISVQKIAGIGPQIKLKLCGTFRSHGQPGRIRAGHRNHGPLPQTDHGLGPP